MLICDSFTLGRLLDFIFAHFALIEFFTFLLKPMLRRNLFLGNICSFHFDIVFSRKKEIIIYIVFGFSLRIYSLACYLYARETFSTIFINVHTFKNLDTNNSV